MTTEFDGDEAFSQEEKAAMESYRGGTAAAEPSEATPAAVNGQQGQQPPAVEKAAGEAAKGAEGEQKGSQFVPHQAFHEERERRKALESELVQQKERFTRLDERLSVMNQLLGNDQKEAGQQRDQMPDPEQDIFGAVKFLIKENNELKGQIGGTQERINQQTAEQRLVQNYRSDATRFMQAEPSFGEAYRHLVNVRAQELQALGVSDAGQISQIISREEMEIAANAARSGKSPAEVIFGLAKIRGYQAKAPVSQDNKEKTEAEKQLETVQKGIIASQSLSGGGGGASEGLTAEKLANMDEDEFAAEISKLSEAQRRKLLGG